MMGIRAYIYRNVFRRNGDGEWRTDSAVADAAAGCYKNVNKH